METRVARKKLKILNPRHRAPQNDADDLVATCVKEIEHEKAGTLRRNLRNILSDYEHCLHVHYMQAEIVKLLVPRHHAEAIIKNLIKVVHSVFNDYDIAGVQVRRDDSSEKHGKRCNAHCAHRALTRTLKG